MRHLSRRDWQREGQNRLYGYHTVKIKKGELGKLSKIQEELDELRDAEVQGTRIIIHCELPILYGAVSCVCGDLWSDDGRLGAMGDELRDVFQQGRRRLLILN